MTVVQITRRKIRALQAEYKTWQEMASDGNSFCRALMLSYIEQCVVNRDATTLLALCTRYAPARNGALPPPSAWCVVLSY